MKDKRQKMTLTWPCGDPVLAAYVLRQAAAATGMQLGPAGPSPSGYPGGLFAAAAAAAAAAAVSTSPFGPMIAPRPPGLPHPPPPHPFVSPISSSSNMPHRPTPNLLAPHLHTPQPPSHPHYLPGSGGLSPRSPPIEGGGIAGSAFSPATPPASCDSSSNANLGQISPQTTTKVDLSRNINMKKERKIDLALDGGRRQSIDKRREQIKDVEEENQQREFEETKFQHNGFNAFERMKGQRENSSASSSSPSPSHSLPENDSNLSPNESKITKKATSTSSSLEVLDGIYMVKSKEHNKNNIVSKDKEKSPNCLEYLDKELTPKNDKANSKPGREDHDDNSIRKNRINYNENNAAKESRSISPSTTSVPSTTSTAASLFQPYLDIEKK